MATIFWDPQAAVNGSGSSDASPKNTLGALSNGDVIRPKYGSFAYFASQWNWGTATGITVLPYGDPVNGRPRITVDTGLTNGINIQGDGTHRFYDVHFDAGSNNVNGGIVGLGLVAASGYGASAEFYGCRWSRTYGHGIFTGESGATASRVVKIIGGEFDDIGHDTFFGGADQFEMAYVRATRLSMRNVGGDGLGWFGVDPTQAWVHHNYFDHRDINTKHCVMFDANTTNAGLMTVEDNYLLCWGDENTAAGASNGPGGVPGNVGINGDGRMIVRRNVIECAGIAINLAGANSVAESNVILVRNGEAGRPVIALDANGAQANHNALVSTRVLPASHVAIAQGSGRTGGVVKNNILSGMRRGIQSDNGASSMSTGYNCVHNVETPYWNSSGSAAFASLGGDVTANPQFLDVLRPWMGIGASSPCRSTGTYIQGARDRFNRRYAGRNIGPWAVLAAA